MPGSSCCKEKNKRGNYTIYCYIFIIINIEQEQSSIGEKKLWVIHLYLLLSKGQKQYRRNKGLEVRSVASIIEQFVMTISMAHSVLLRLRKFCTRSTSGATTEGIHKKYVTYYTTAANIEVRLVPEVWS